MKKIIAITLCVALLPLQAFAQDGLEFSRARGDQNSLREVREMIRDLETSISQMENFIAEVKACGDRTPRQLYNGTSCVTPEEDDPSVAAHGKAAMNNSCSSQSAQVYINSAWRCKSFDNQVGQVQPVPGGPETSEF